MTEQQQYTPTTEQVREFIGLNGKTGDVAKFDAWLAKVRAEARAEALRDHAKRIAYWNRDASQRALRYSVENVVADLEDAADREEQS